jgi:hypothetical protein
MKIEGYYATKVPITNQGYGAKTQLSMLYTKFMKVKDAKLSLKKLTDQLD